VLESFLGNTCECSHEMIGSPLCFQNAYYLKKKIDFPFEHRETYTLFETSTCTMASISSTSVTRTVRVPNITNQRRAIDANSYPKKSVTRHVSKTHQQSIHTIINETENQITVELVINYVKDNKVTRMKRFLHVDTKK